MEVGRRRRAGVGRGHADQDPGARRPDSGGDLGAVALAGPGDWAFAALGAGRLAVFFLLWPWLWFDPYHRFLEYAGRTAQRSVLYVWYFGQRYADREVPWHYPALLFFTTVPLGLVALGVLGIFKGPRPPWKERAGHLVLGAMLFPLVLFSLPRVSVYDGARLFLVVFPLWAIFIGRGGAIAYDKLREKLSPRVTVTVAACFLAGQAWGLVGTWPCFLSYYNMGLGGLRGADRLGMEIDYWGEAVTRDFLEQVVTSVPEGAHIDVAPVLLPQQHPNRRDAGPVPPSSPARNRVVGLRAGGKNPCGIRGRLSAFRRPLAGRPRFDRAKAPRDCRATQRRPSGWFVEDRQIEKETSRGPSRRLVSKFHAEIDRADCFVIALRGSVCRSTRASGSPCR